MTTSTNDLLQAIRNRLYAGFPEFPQPTDDADLPAYIDILAGHWTQMVTLTRVTFEGLQQLDNALRAAFPQATPPETDPA